MSLERVGFISVPPGAEPGFDATGLSLLPLAVAALGPLVFVNPDRDPPPLHLDLDPEGLRFESSEQREHSGDLQPTTFEADATGLTGIDAGLKLNKVTVTGGGSGYTLCAISGNKVAVGTGPAHTIAVTTPAVTACP